jgi:hypothetical protein
MRGSEQERYVKCTYVFPCSNAVAVCLFTTITALLTVFVVHAGGLRSMSAVAVA